MLNLKRGLTKQQSNEHSEQVGLVLWFRRRFPDVLIFAIPNGEYRAISTAKKLKAEGVVPGIPDLFIPSWKLWVEMKRSDGGVISPEQHSIHGYLERVGYTIIVGNGAEDASRKILAVAADKRGEIVYPVK